MRYSAFTLAELLIALSILGLIAAFTIPKVLQAQNDTTYNSIAKEAAASVYAAQTELRRQNLLNASTSLDDLTPYLNYLYRDTVNQVDDAQIDGTFNCWNASRYCLKLHNGAMLIFDATVSFGGTGNLNAINFWVDPDGIADGTTNAKSVPFFLYYNGRLSDRGSILPNTSTSQTTHVAGGNPAKIPPWFSWN